MHDRSIASSASRSSTVCSCSRRAVCCSSSASLVDPACRSTSSPTSPRPRSRSSPRPPGMAPEEVEIAGHLPHRVGAERRARRPPGALASRPTASRSSGSSSTGATDIYRARQVVTERLQARRAAGQARAPELGPISSIMGEITFIALTSERVSPMELRRVAETMVRRSLLAHPRRLAGGPDRRRGAAVPGRARPGRAGAARHLASTRSSTRSQRAQPQPGRRLPRRRGPGVPGPRPRPRATRRGPRGHGRARRRAACRSASARSPPSREAPEPARGTASYETRPAVDPQRPEAARRQHARAHARDRPRARATSAARCPRA